MLQTKAINYAYACVGSDEDCVKRIVESRFFEPPRQTKIYCFEKSDSLRNRGKITRLIEKGKRLFVRVIGKFDKLRVRNIGIPLYCIARCQCMLF